MRPIVRAPTWIVVNHIATPVSAPSTKLTSTRILEVAVDERARVGVPAALRQPLEVAQQHAAADRELREEHVEDPDPADDHALHQRAELVDRVERDRRPRALDANAPVADVRRNAATSVAVFAIVCARGNR